ncbi:hypothetical protein K432DRAFT_332201 [Lepidopterella palustris CBS 459.81]|uniref:Uncharacterized protein n=1 Tax=Lepidopterella palustris CBS 459.81 TaxID=1314670 RepID=A0A8E2E720_9PEZI|nr:hypothetical protein K432DRAFT_332201 [Lepidopterella palustris CBS 459.81]
MCDECKRQNSAQRQRRNYHILIAIFLVPLPYILISLNLSHASIQKSFQALSIP